MAFGDFTGLDLINILREGFETDFFGSTQIAILGIFIFIIVLCMMSGLKREGVALVPVPIIVAIVDAAAAPLWVKVIALMLAGFYMGVIILNMVKERSG
ncbi:hypothetical protein LCGC14_0651080 [marine sediment metagenome]|uniref:Uncharacterized protein n=1 Tax=marine sediment metagenome TaxID=412755 RepID=A0A0F9R1H5_9ZZZZ